MVDERAETQRPESFLERHLHRALFRQSLEDALRLLLRADVELHCEALRFLILLRVRVGARQYVVAYGEHRMEDLLAPVGRRLFSQGRSPVRHHHDDFGAQALLVELKGRLALAVECQIGIQSHHSLL